MIGATTVLAIYGAVLSTVALGWNLYRDVHNRARELRKRLTEELYLPARRQLAEALPTIQNRQRAFPISTEMWKKASASGITRKLKTPLRTKLEALYERTLPRYDQAWQEVSKEIDRLTEEWDKNFGDIHEYQIAAKQHIVEIKWWNFLTEDSPVTPIDGLRDGDVLRLHNSFMTPGRFKMLNLSPEQFLVSCWQEAARNEAVRQYRELKKRALKDIPVAITLLDRSSLY